MSFWLFTCLVCVQGFVLSRHNGCGNGPLQVHTRDGADLITNERILIPPYAVESNVQFEQYPSVLHSVHIKSVLTDEEANTALDLACSFAASTGRWDQPDFDRHATYATCDFPVEDSPELQSYLENEVGLTDSIWQHLHECFGIDCEDMTYLDFFCVNYQAKSSGTTMDRLESHRDGSLLSFTVTLSPPEDFKGGGTYFEALRSAKNNGTSIVSGGVVRPKRAGDAVLHSGKLLHGADVVTEGSRTVLVGFVDVADWCMRPGVLSAATREWGRMDVAIKRHERQLEKAGSLPGQKSWRRKSGDKWLPKAEELAGRGKSHIQNICPAFSSVVRRADNTFQSQRRLEVEDAFLRSILLSPAERQEPLSLFEGDVTIL